MSGNNVSLPTAPVAADPSTLYNPMAVSVPKLAQYDPSKIIPFGATDSGNSSGSTSTTDGTTLSKEAQGIGGNGSVSGGSGQAVTYKTSGGYTITVDHGTVTITDPQGNKVGEWGDPHESYNGTDGSNGTESTWSSNTRTIHLGDGTVVTMKASANNGAIQTVEIFDGKAGSQQETVIDAQNDTYTQKKEENGDQIDVADQNPANNGADFFNGNFVNH